MADHKARQQQCGWEPGFIGLWPIKALVIADWGWLKEQAGLGRGWKTTGSWDQDWERAGDKKQAWEAVAGQTGPPVSCPNLPPPDIADFLLS